MNKSSHSYVDIFSLPLEDRCRAFGSKASVSNALDGWMKIWSESVSNINAFVVLAASRTAEIEGISAAGATRESRRYTAIADAELLLKGPSLSRNWPLPPLQAGVSPALISFVSSQMIGVDPLIIAAGLEQALPFPHVIADSTFDGPSNCISTGKAMDINRVELLWNKGLEMGTNLSAPLFLAECVPGGTTTALAVLTGLGVSASQLISGSHRIPPVELKKKIVLTGLKAAGLGKNPQPRDVLAAVGDPFQPFAAGLILGARHAGQPVLLGGGSQMVAVLSSALASLDVALRKKFLENTSIATTAWLANESVLSHQTQSSFACLINLVEEFFHVSLLALSSGLRFSQSSKRVLRDYELGFVKEGVGAGAFSLLAQLNGISCKKLIQECENAVEQLNCFI